MFSSLKLVTTSPEEIARRIRDIDAELSALAEVVAEAALAALEGDDSSAGRKKTAEAERAKLEPKRRDLRAALDAAEAREQRAAAATAEAAAAAERAEKAKVYRKARDASRDRLQVATKLAAALGEAATHWRALEEANGALYASIPNVDGVLDLDGALMRRSQLAGNARLELARQGCDWSGAVSEPHTIPHMVDVLTAADEFIARRLSEVSGLTL